MKSKLNQILTNKKTVIIALAVVLALALGIVILVTGDPKETGGKDTDAKAEQSKEDINVQDDKEDADANDIKDDSSGLQVLEPDEVAAENSSDASGSWDNTSDSGTQSGNTNTNDNTNKTDDQNQNNNSNDSDKKDGEEPEKNEDILEDDITWGNIY